MSESVIQTSPLSNPVHCKKCNAPAVKYGTYKGKQLWWCKVCKKKFKADDTTFHMKTDVNEVSSSLNMYYEGMSISAIQRHLKQEFNHSPSSATIYEWIQRTSATRFATLADNSGRQTEKDKS